MPNINVFEMSFAKVYSCLIAKAGRKDRLREEVNTITAWLTGYSEPEIEALMLTDITYGDFFRRAPQMNPNRELVRGTICGVRIESIEDPLMKDIRILDKMVDELAKGKAMEKILR